jgi:hypothetical protein
MGFPKNVEDVPHKRGFFNKSGASKRFGSGVKIYFGRSKAYTPPYEIIDIEQYILTIRTNRLLDERIGEDDVTGYEIHGVEVRLQPAYDKYDT